ncbi:MAG: response regulator [Candidatus Competibacterales bacterium]|nr:response regulator [Candidatus Competibacterales bacterium]
MTVNKVLVVDDSTTEIAHLRSILSDTGCAVVSASNGQEALELARREHPDLIFLDIIMPGMDGYATCRELQNDEARISFNK